ncbi:hypothetical protein ABBQ32_006742 [Trebouxia sp. C0010 RCD-2024]
MHTAMTLVSIPVVVDLPTRRFCNDRFGMLHLGVSRPRCTDKEQHHSAVCLTSHADRARYLHLAAQCQSDQRQHVQQATSNISILDPDIQQQWDHAGNAHLGNMTIKPCSNRKVYCACDQHPDGHSHNWVATVSNRTKGRGCPQWTGQKVCKHNSLATKAAAVAAQWDHEANNGTPDSVVAHSCTKNSWHCGVCGCI